MTDVEHNCTDLGNAMRLVARYGDRLRYVFAWKLWLWFDGCRWARDEDGQIVRCAKTTALSIYGEAERATTEPRRKELARWAVESESARRLNAAVSLATSEPGIAVKVAELDSNPMLFNVANGTLDLASGTLRAHAAEDMITKRSPIAWNPQASCPVFIAYLDRVLAGDAELIAFMQRAIGYTLTGRTDEQVLFLLYGAGANGKSVLLELLLHLTGDYGAKADFSTFLSGKRDGPRNDLAALVGARFVSASEAGEGRKFDEATVKAITGGDSITSRFLFQESFTYRPQFTLWLAANAKPDVQSVAEAWWRRIRLIPFAVTIPEAERDPRLLDQLISELPGILTWAVEGCLAWQRDGLGRAEAVTMATTAYREESDVLAAFLEQECTVNPADRVSSSWLFKAYCEWASRNGERALSQTKFSVRLTEKKIPKVKDGSGRMMFVGLQLRNTANNSPEGIGGLLHNLSSNTRLEKGYENGGLQRVNPPLSLDDDAIERAAIQQEGA
jgi:putative DNA primase/helicase